MARPPSGNAKSTRIAHRRHCVGSRGARCGCSHRHRAAAAVGALGLAQHTVPSQVALERAASAPLSSYLHSTRALTPSVPEALCVHVRGCPSSSPPQRERVKARGERSAQTTQLVAHGRRRCLRMARCRRPSMAYRVPSIDALAAADERDAQAASSCEHGAGRL